jgi:hypothetical protein
LVVHDIVAVVRVVEVLTALITGGLFTFAVVDAVLVLLDVSVAKAQRVVEPLGTFTVFQETAYNVLLAMEVEPTSVLEASVAPKLPS